MQFIGQVNFNCSACYLRLIYSKSHYSITVIKQFINCYLHYPITFPIQLLHVCRRHFKFILTIAFYPIYYLIGVSKLHFILFLRRLLPLYFQKYIYYPLNNINHLNYHPEFLSIDSDPPSNTTYVQELSNVYLSCQRNYKYYLRFINYLPLCRYNHLFRDIFLCDLSNPSILISPHRNFLFQVGDIAPSLIDRYHNHRLVIIHNLNLNLNLIIHKLSDLKGIIINGLRYIHLFNSYNTHRLHIRHILDNLLNNHNPIYVKAGHLHLIGYQKRHIIQEDRQRY